VDKNNFGPRVGFAYSPSGGLFGGAGRTSIRGGAGHRLRCDVPKPSSAPVAPQLQTEQNPQLTCASAGRPAWCATNAGFLAGGGLLAVNVPPATQAEARSATQAIIVDQTQPKTFTWTLERSEAGLDQLGVRSSISGNARFESPRSVFAETQSACLRETRPGSADLSQPFPGSSHRPGNSSDSPAILDAEDLRYSAQGFDGGFVSAFDPIGSSI